MAITRINNNQITDSVPGNLFVGVNAAVKLQDFTITAGKIQNNLTYGSDLTITGNLTVQGNTTAIDTVNLVVEDPLILLAKEQTGSPALDIGFIGKRGTEDNIAFVFDESEGQFVTVFTTSEVTNTTITVNSFASLQVLNITAANANITGNLTFNGSILGNVDVTGNVTAGNVISDASVDAVTITASGNLVGGNAVVTGDVGSATVTATGNVSGGNVATAGAVAATGNVSGGNVTTAGTVAATGNVSGGNVNADSAVTAGTTITATGNVAGGNVTTAGVVAATGNVAGGNVTTVGNVDGANVNASAGITAGTTVVATGNVAGGNVTTAGNVDGANINASAGITAGTTIVATGNVSGGNVTTAGAVVATGNIAGGNVTTAGNVDGANLNASSGITAGTTVTATGNVSGGNVTTAGNVDGANVNASAGISAGTTIVATGNIAGGNISTTGRLLTGTLETTGDSLIGGNLVVQGNLTFINVEDLRVEDPIIILGTGPNGVPLTADDGKDRGVYMEYFDTATANAFMGFQNISGNMIIANDVEFSGNDVIQINSFGNLNVGNLFPQSLNTGAGNVTAGNLNTAGQVVATGNVSGGNLVTLGNVDGANINASSGITAGTTVVATGNVSGGNVTTAGAVSATGNVVGGNLNTAGAVVATGNVSGGNVSAGTGIISTTGNIDGANVNATANVTGAGAVFSGNVTAANFVGNIQGNIDAGGANTNIQFNDDDILNGSTAFTFDKTSNAVTATGNVTAGNIDTAGLIVATGNVSGGNVATAGAVVATGNVSGGNVTTAGVVAATGNVSGGNITTVGNIDSANVNASGTVTATGNVTGGNVVTTGTADLGNIRVTGNDITNSASNIITVNTAASDIDVRISGDTVANLLVTDAGTDTVLIGTGTPTVGAALKIGTTDSFMLPVGNIAQRPGAPETGMLRFSTTSDSLEVFDGVEFVEVGVPEFTVIVADAFVGNGSAVVFTLSEDSTTAGTIVAINGIVQEPTTAYAVAGNVLTFTEAPAVSDNIDARIITTTTTVTKLVNVSGNAQIQALDTAATIQVIGNLLPETSNTFNLGSTTLRWNELFLEGSTITLGNVVIKNTSGNTVGFFGPDGTTPGAIDTNNIDSAGISNGNSSLAVIASGGNIRANVAGNTVGVLSSSGLLVTGSIEATNGFIGLDASKIQNGTSNVSVVTSNGNVDVNVNGNAIVTFSSGGIDNRQSNGVGNIGTTSSQFNTIFAKATSAQYADLAEMYESDAEYAPGTVLCFGGNQEVTVCDSADCVRVAGVVSTNPSYLMNSGQPGEHVVAVALTGRVPTLVSGSVRKGDLMVSTEDGRARANNAAAVGTVLGKALEDFDGTTGMIEVVVGRV